jgi:hypothetical protein
MIRGTFQGVLCMASDGEPYAVPVNHAYQDGRFYFHCATTGRKLDIISQNPNVSYVITKFYGDRRDLDKSLKCHGPWESVIAYGKARVVSEQDELIRTFKTFMKYFGEDDYQHGENLLLNTRVIVIEVERMTARREYDEFRTDYWYWEREA